MLAQRIARTLGGPYPLAATQHAGTTTIALTLLVSSTADVKSNRVLTFICFVIPTHSRFPFTNPSSKQF
jgi:hypothetical protein